MSVEAWKWWSRIAWGNDDYVIRVMERTLRWEVQHLTSWRLPGRAARRRRRNAVRDVVDREVYDVMDGAFR